MKRKFPTVTCLASAVLVIPSTADVIYSNLQDLAIPADFDGVFLNVETGAWNNDTNSPVTGWDINAFFGGTVLWNSPSFQPVRSGTTSTSAVLNLATGTTVSSGSAFSTFTQGPGGQNPGGAGYGASETHVGTGTGKFVAGEEGYMGFQLNGGNYGYMRVVFTDNTGGALIKEWAYDNSGAAISTGNIVRTGSNVSMDTTAGAFTVSSAITDSAGTTNLIKSGSNTATLSGSSSYTGTTTVSAGTLLVTGALGSSGSSTGVVSVNSGASLGGSGEIYGSVTFDGGSYLAIQEIANPLKVTGSVTFGAGFGVDNLTGIDWDSLDIGTHTLISDTTTSFSVANIDNFGIDNKVSVGSQDRFAYFQNGSLALVVIPESSTTLMGLSGLLALSLLRRRRSA